MGLSVRLSVTLALGQEPFEIGSCNLVCGTSMNIKETCIFFLSIGFVIAELLPFSFVFHFQYIVSLWKLVNKVSQEPLKPGPWYYDHRLCLRYR